VDVLDRIRQQVEENPIILYMKGTPQFPMCGFSSRTVEALKSTGAQYAYVNVLQDQEVRANLPRFSDWPTFPQLYVNGELVGGCDIVMELYQTGELKNVIDAAAGANAPQ